MAARKEAAREPAPAAVPEGKVLVERARVQTLIDALTTRERELAEALEANARLQAVLEALEAEGR